MQARDRSQRAYPYGILVGFEHGNQIGIPFRWATLPTYRLETHTIPPRRVRPTSSDTLSNPFRAAKDPRSSAIRNAASGSTKLRVPTATASAPAIINSAASFQIQTPPAFCTSTAISLISAVLADSFT